MIYSTMIEVAESYKKLMICLCHIKTYILFEFIGLHIKTYHIQLNYVKKESIH